ncbi:MAG: bifunctional 2-polyprenyl-6-hydroxyphenol methylase/3-demethylubiquinol 3-O-methyltransferase UbiG [Pseudomonadota bacterium]
MTAATTTPPSGSDPNTAAERTPASKGGPLAAHNADAGEIAQFDRIAADWWDPAGPFKPLHDLAPARLGFIRAEIDDHFHTDPRRLRPLKGRRVLDVGCGGGLVTEPLARLGGEVTGIDLGAATVAVAQHHADQADLAIAYRAAAIEDLVAEGATFDVVTCLEVIEHVPDAPAFAEAVASVVAPGGLLIMSTINRTAKAYALAIIGAEYVLGWLDRGTHDWSKFVTPRELTNALEQAGLSVDSRTGLTLDPMTARWQTSDDLDVNYMLAARRPA